MLKKNVHYTGFLQENSLVYRREAGWHHSPAVHSGGIHWLGSLSWAVIGGFCRGWTTLIPAGQEEGLMSDASPRSSGSIQSLSSPRWPSTPSAPQKKLLHANLWLCTSEKAWIKTTRGPKHPLGLAAILASLQGAHRIISLAGIRSY